MEVAVGGGRRHRRLTHQQRDVVTLCAARPISDSHARASQGRGDTTDRMRDMRRLSLGRQFYIMNHILFLNYPNYIYIFFPYGTFALGILS